MDISGLSIETTCAKAVLMDSGIVYLDFFEEHYHELDQAKEHIKQLKAFLGLEKRPFLSNIQKVKSVSKEIRNYLVDEEVSQICLCNSILVDSTISRMLGNLFITFNKPSYPNKVFSNYDAAYQWTLTFLEK